MDEGVLQSEAQNTLIQLRLGSKLPSLRILLPHGRRKNIDGMIPILHMSKNRRSIIERPARRTGFFHLNGLPVQSINGR